jgi:SAM-dependent methyltransferase
VLTKTPLIILYTLWKRLLSDSNSLVPCRTRNHLRFSSPFLRLGIKLAKSRIQAEFPNLCFPDLEHSIDRKDGMYVHDHPAHYFYVAYSALACVWAVCIKQSRETFQSILDLPCGHGRVLRAFRAAFPDAKLTACDLDTRGVDFCVRSFGATGVYSDEDPAKIAIRDKFDLIWVGSLFTHLSADRWRLFLGRFQFLLARKGLLFLTTHGAFVAEQLEKCPEFYGLSRAQAEMVRRQYENDGFGYARYHKCPECGISVSAMQWVKSCLAPAFELVAFMPAAWDHHHDVSVVQLA